MEPFEPYYTSLSCFSLQIFSILYFFNSGYIHYYFSLLITWANLCWNHWCASTLKPPSREIDSFLPVSMSVLLPLYYLHSWVSPLAVVWTYLLLAMPATSLYLMSTLTPSPEVYKDMRSVSMMLAMSVAVFVVSEVPVGTVVSRNLLKWD